MRNFSLFAVLAVAITLVAVLDASAFGRRGGCCGGNRQGPIARFFHRGDCSGCGGCGQSAGQYAVPYNCPLTGCGSVSGCPTMFTTPNCSGGVCAPCGLPANYGFQLGCPNGVCRPAR